MITRSWCFLSLRVQTGRNERQGLVHLAVQKPERQAERLAPQFTRLQNALEKRRIAIQNNSLGIKPEMVLVLETIGAVQDFFQAVKKVAWP